MRLDNATPLRHVTRYGTLFRADRADLVGGVMVSHRRGLTYAALAGEFAEFGAWHALQIRPELSHFSGYNTIQYTIREER